MNLKLKRIHSDGSSLCSNGKQSKLGIIGQGTGLVWETMLHALQQIHKWNQVYNIHTVTDIEMYHAKDFIRKIIQCTLTIKMEHVWIWLNCSIYPMLRIYIYSSIDQSMDNSDEH